MTVFEDSASTAREQLFPGASEMAQLMRAFDWSRTPLGSPAGWPRNLRIALGICLSSRFPLQVWWGRDLTLFYNDASISFLGRTKHPAVLGRSGREAWAEVWHQIGPRIETVLTTGQASWSEDILLCFDRELRREEVYVTFSFSPVLGEAGGVEGLFCAGTETTRRASEEEQRRARQDLAALVQERTTELEQANGALRAEGEARKRTEEALRVSEERFRFMIQTVQDYAIFLMDSGGHVASWNEGAQRLLGYAADEVLGRPAALFFTEEDRQNGLFERELRTVVAAGWARDENWQVRKDGSRFWASGTTSAVRDAAGGLRGFAKIFRDLTERKTAEDALREKDVRLRAALAAARMGTWHWDIAADRQSLDESLHRLLGLPPEPTVHTLAEFLRSVHPDDRDRVAEAFHRSVEQGVSLNVEFRVLWPDGRMRWLKDQGDVVCGDDGRPLFLTGACVDITERKQEEEARARDAQVLASVRDSVIVTDLDGIITYWNKGATRLFGWSAEEMLGRPYADRFPEPTRSWIQDQLRSRAAGTEWSGEYQDWRKDGSRVWIDARVGRVVDAAGRPFALLGIAHDITERKRMEAELRRQAEELREAGRRKDEFLAMLGHELRNPLAPLRGVVEALRRQRPADPAVERAYVLMERQVEHLSRLVDDLLDVSRIIRGVVELRKEPVNLTEVAHQAVEMASPVIESRRHDLMLLMPGKPLWVDGDATRLTQVIYNLLNNAAKYTEPGGKIRLTVEREGTLAVVRVRDNGSGMPGELVPRVFELFTQGERKPDRSQGGLGLGLTLVKRLVELHGGSVEAHSEGPGKGSEFGVRLPTLPAEAVVPSPPTRPSAVPQAAVPVERVLVVDDNPDVAESLVMLLEGLARDIRIAPSGPQALAVARDYRPDLILCDIGLPGMDGYEVARRLRQEPGLEKVLLVAVSGYGQEEDRRRSQGAGFDRHLVKPIGRGILEELVQAVRTAR